MKRLSGLMVAALTLALIVGVSSRADAAFQLFIDNSVSGPPAGDGSVILLTDADGDGALFYGCGGAFPACTGALSGWNIIITSALSDPATAPPYPHTDLSFQATGTGTLNIWLTDTDFSSTGATINTHFGGTVASGGTVTGRAWFDLANTPFGTGTLIGSACGPMPAGSFACDRSGGPVTDPSYSVTQQVLITHTTLGTSSGDYELMVPEPASMALFGLGLMGFGVLSRRRKANKSAE